MCVLFLLERQHPLIQISDVFYPFYIRFCDRKYAFIVYMWYEFLKANAITALNGCDYYDYSKRYSFSFTFINIEHVDWSFFFSSSFCLGFVCIYIFMVAKTKSYALNTFINSYFNLYNNFYTITK